MEKEQATLPFVVPSHLSKLFGLKASVIVEGEGAGGRDESERQRERGGRERVPGANSTCWGDGETAVRRGGVEKNTGPHSSSTLSACVSFPSLCFCYRFNIVYVTSAPPPPPLSP